MEVIPCNCQFELFVDNYYSSINLAEKLKKNGVDLTATMKKNYQNFFLGMERKSNG
jgi:hypothetical protein